MNKLPIVATVGLLLVPLISIAAETRHGEQPMIPASETIRNDLYVAGGNVTSSGAIVGDLVAAGGNLLLNSPVSADLMAAGGTITVLGNVGDDLRVAGGTIIVNGSVGGDFVVGGGQTQISGVGVKGDVLWGGGSLTVGAPVGGDLRLGGGEVRIDAPIKGNVEFRGGKLTLGSHAVIEGSLTYTSPKEAVLESGAIVRGKTTYEQSKGGRETNKAGFFAFLSLALLAKFVSILVCALLIGLLFRRFSERLVETAVSAPLLEIGRGLLTLIVLPIASVILLITVIGLPLGFLGLISFAALMLFSMLATPIVIGTLVYHWITRSSAYEISWKTILLGTFVYLVLGFIPFVGWIACLGAFLLTIGAVVKIKWDLAKEWR